MQYQTVDFVYIVMYRPSTELLVHVRQIDNKIPHTAENQERERERNLDTTGNKNHNTGVNALENREVGTHCDIMADRDHIVTEK